MAGENSGARRAAPFLPSVLLSLYSGSGSNTAYPFMTFLPLCALGYNKTNNLTH
jgi:hypothetical protein